MSQAKMALLEKLTQQYMGVPLQTLAPMPIGIERVQTALWDANATFGLGAEALRQQPYKAKYGAAADAALRAWLLDKTPLATAPPLVQRVLQERHTQAHLLCVAKAADAGSFNAHFMSVPQGAGGQLIDALAIAWLLYEMALPFPVGLRVPPAAR